MTDITGKITAARFWRCWYHLGSFPFGLQPSFPFAAFMWTVDSFPFRPGASDAVAEGPMPGFCAAMATPSIPRG